MSRLDSPFSEPFTPRGVAAFARAKFSRLLLAQFIAALVAAAAVVWFLGDACFPVVRAAVQNLPDAGNFSAGKLDWSGAPAQMLAEGKFLAFDVDLNHSGQIRSIADIQIEFGADSLRIFSLLGYVEIFYPSGFFTPFNRPALEPLWNAWSAEILFFAGVATVIGLPLVWAALATIYFLPVWILGFFANRDLNFRAGWKLSGAALLPGALLLTAAIFFYNFGALTLVQFIFIFAAHFVLGWIYLFAGLLFVPRNSAAPSGHNPFKPRR